MSKQRKKPLMRTAKDMPYCISCMITRHLCLCLNKQLLITCLHVWQLKPALQITALRQQSWPRFFHIHEAQVQNSRIPWQKFHLLGRRLDLFLNCKNSYHCSRMHWAPRVHVYNTSSLTLLWLKNFIKNTLHTQWEIAEKEKCIGLKERSTNRGRRREIKGECDDDWEKESLHLK